MGRVSISVSLWNLRVLYVSVVANRDKDSPQSHNTEINSNRDINSRRAELTYSASLFRF